MPDLKAAVARFGADVKAKLANPGASGEPEDQLRAPLEGLFAELAELCGFLRAENQLRWPGIGQPVDRQQMLTNGLIGAVCKPPYEARKPA